MSNENSPEEVKSKSTRKFSLSVFILMLLLISIVSGFLIELILGRIKIDSNYFYGGLSSLISFLIITAFVLKNREQLKKEDSEELVIWLVISLFYVGLGGLFVTAILFIKNISLIYAYDAFFLGIFCIILGLFIYKRRDNLKREGPMYLYKTKVGIRLIDYIGTKYKKTFGVLSYFSVISGYILMLSMIYFLYTLLKIYLFQPNIVRQVPIFPLMPLVPYVPELFKIPFLPPFYFTYWIIAIAVIAVFHEFSHGIFARRFGVRIKTTGFGFLGPFLAAFVEPDEKEMEKRPKFQQIAILSAGTFANILLTILFILILIGFFAISHASAGVKLISPINENVIIKDITMIDGLKLQNKTSDAILDLINENKIKDDVLIRCEDNSINFTSVTANNMSYLVPLKNLKSQLENNKESLKMMFDFPAIRQCLSKITLNGSTVRLEGLVIQEIEGKKIQRRSDIEDALKNFKPGDKIKITFTNTGGIWSKDIILGENPFSKEKPNVGLAFPQIKEPKTFLTKILTIYNYIKDPIIDYKPKWSPELVLFIYNLLLWLILINFSVALLNMWPVAIFDGGRTFMLTIWAITKSEKLSKIAFRVVTYIILACVVLVIYGYFAAVY